MLNDKKDIIIYYQLLVHQTGAKLHKVLCLKCLSKYHISSRGHNFDTLL